MANGTLEARVRERGISRLCHFTRSVTLPLIVERGEIAATSRLMQDERATCYPNDDQRLDGHRTRVSCSIQYPNIWLLRKLQNRHPHVQDWIVLTIDPDSLWHDGTLFCPVNAATAWGKYIGTGLEAFDALFSASTPGRFSRSPNHLASCPTDNQAEVLVAGGVPLDHVRCIVVPTEAQAQRERGRLQGKELRTAGFGIAVCPEFFSPSTLWGRIGSGEETDPRCEPL
jgi:hypothetical protein